ncbi:hypothetical protein REPUB_Repub13aG0241500 [Reevesia pubescens]
MMEFDDSMRLFEDIPERSVVSWNALLSYYVQSHYCREVVELFHEMIGNLDDALIIFEEIAKPDIVSWNAVIVGCVLHENHDWALELFGKMRRSGKNPNMFTLSSALKACAGNGLKELGKQLHCNLIKLNVGLDPFMDVGLIYMYSKSDLMNDARMVLNLMPDKDLIAFKAIIFGHLQNEKDMEAAKYVCKQVHAIFMKSGFESDNYVVNSLIDAYGKYALLEDATRIFREHLIVGLVAFTSTITAYSQSGQGEEALKLYLEMLDRGIKLDPYVCSSLLNTSANLSAYEQGKQVYVHILKYGFMSYIFAGKFLVNMYPKCGSIDDAEQVFSKILERGIFS